MKQKCMFFWNYLVFSMIKWILAIWSLIPLPFLKPTWTSGSSRFTYCWSLACGFLIYKTGSCKTLRFNPKSLWYHTWVSLLWQKKERSQVCKNHRCFQISSLQLLLFCHFLLPNLLWASRRKVDMLGFLFSSGQWWRCLMSTLKEQRDLSLRRISAKEGEARKWMFQKRNNWSLNNYIIVNAYVS